MSHVELGKKENRLREDLCNVEWFAERDIDVWLAEELRINAAFADWLIRKMGLPQGLTVPAFETRVSVIQGRETDVQALFRMQDGSICALLIEDKIKANFQPNQMQDHIKRGDTGKKEGRWAQFRVLVFAPSYRFPILDLPPGILSVSFEEASIALRASGPNDQRSSYRAEFLDRASKPKTLVAADVSELVRRWWEEVNPMIIARFGSFYPPQAPTKDSYVSPRWNGQPTYLRPDIKGHKGEVALALKGFSESAAREIPRASGERGLVVRKDAGWIDPAICIASDLPKYYVGDDLDEVRERVLTAYEAGYRLYRFWQAHHDKFERARPVKELPA